MEAISKICTKCSIDKPLEEFGAQEHGLYNRCSQCKECRKKDRLSKIDHVHAINKKYYESNKKTINKRNITNYYKNIEQRTTKGKEWREKNKEKLITKRKELYQNEEFKNKQREANRLSYEKHKEERQQKNKEWSRNNQEKIKQYQRNYYQKNKERIDQREKERRLKNPKIKIIKPKLTLEEKKIREKERRDTEQFRVNRRKYKHENRHKEYARRKRKKSTDPLYNLKLRLRSRYRKSFFFERNAKKSAKTLELLGCSLEFFLSYLETKFYARKLPNGESQMMTRQDLCTSEVEIDHIIPLFKFNLVDSEEQKKACSYTNLQPLWKEDHIIKSKKDHIDYYAMKNSGIPLQDYLKSQEKEADPYKIWN